MNKESYVGRWITVLGRTRRTYFDYCAEKCGISSSHIFFCYVYAKNGK